MGLFQNRFCFRFILTSSLALTTLGLLFVPPGFFSSWRFTRFSHRTLANRDEAPPAPTHSPSNQSDICQNFYQTICSKTGEVRDPTGTVRSDLNGEVQALRLYEEIISANPDWTSKQINEKLVEEIYTPKRRARIETAFQWVKHTMVTIIDHEPDSVFTRREKRRLKQRVQKMELELPPSADVYADEPDLFTKTDIYYQRTDQDKLRVRVGGAYLINAKSWFNLVFTLGHELAHAIDPCEVRSAHQSYPAYDHLTSCFLSQKLVLSRKMRAECGENDQLSETFADWFGVAVTAEALKTYATEFHGQALTNSVINAVRDLCEQDEEPGEELDLEFHPSPKVRIEKILGLNPQIREILGCTPPQDSPQYCGFMSSLP